jgi:polysaccharide export outer membrane protein
MNVMSRWLYRLLVCLSVAHLVYAADNKYILGPSDQINIRCPHVQEVDDKTIRIDTAGSLTLPLVGRIQASGMSVDALETAISDRLKDYYVQPEVSIYVTEYKSQPVSIFGSVRAPGVYQLQGSKTLIEMLSTAGGLADDAGYRIQLTRTSKCGIDSFTNFKHEERGGAVIATVEVKSLMDGSDPSWNIPVCSNDVISVPRANLIYVIGEVHKQGGFALRENQSFSVLQAVSLAEGLTKTSSASKAKILRPQADGAERLEMPIDLKKILDGQAPDFQMLPNDILVVPNSAPKSGALRALDAAIQIGTGVVIWR